MWLAPDPPITARLAGLSNGRAGAFQTLRMMRNLVDAAKVDPAFIQQAINVSYFTPERDEAGIARALYEYVRDSVRYVKDVHGVETLSTPQLTLSRRVGDCDDQSTLLCALAESIGIPSRFVMTGHSGNEFEHVFCQLAVNGQWITCDPTEPEFFGWSPPYPTVLFIERV